MVAQRAKTRPRAGASRGLTGSLLFDFRTYRALDEASRRLFLLLKKVFWRNAESPEFDLHDLAVDTIGFAPTQEPRHLKRKLLRCMEKLMLGNNDIVR